MEGVIVRQRLEDFQEFLFLMKVVLFAWARRMILKSLIRILVPRRVSGFLLKKVIFPKILVRIAIIMKILYVECTGIWYTLDAIAKIPHSIVQLLVKSFCYIAVI